VRYDEWRFLVQARVGTAQTVWAPDYEGAGVRLARASGDLAVCRGFRTGQWELAPCLGLTLDHFAVRGSGPDITARSRNALVTFVDAGGAAHRYFLDWLALVASAGAGVATSRPRFYIDEYGSVGRLGPVEVNLGLGLECLF
jgi:hypothetical protein